MTLERAIEILEAYNKWKKDDLQHYPYKLELSLAIDTVVKHLKK